MDLRTVVAVVVLALLARVARVAWRQRSLAMAVWRAIGWRHVAGALGLLVVVGGVASLLFVGVPVTRLGLGTLVGTGGGNAVFAPLEVGLSSTGPPPEAGPDWVLVLAGTAFLVPLAALLPWLAFVEEELFRAGLERRGAGRVALASLGFGLVHLVMFVPLAAALAIAVAGGFYARVYRRAHATADPARVPAVARRAFRPTRRSARAADHDRSLPGTGHGPPVPDAVVVLDRTPEQRQATGVFHAAVWHTTFNTLVVGAVWLSLVSAALG